MIIAQHSIRIQFIKRTAWIVSSIHHPSAPSPRVPREEAPPQGSRIYLFVICNVAPQDSGAPSLVLCFYGFRPRFLLGTARILCDSFTTLLKRGKRGHEKKNNKCDTMLSGSLECPHCATSVGRT